MAKDDYDVIVYRLLVYLYGCLKRKILFDSAEFRETVKKNVESEEYFADVVRMMQQEGLIEGAVIIKAWGGDVIITSDLQDIKITSAGIHYLKDNSQMHKVGTILRESADIISKLAGQLMLP